MKRGLGMHAYTLRVPRWLEVNAKSAQYLRKYTKIAPILQDFWNTLCVLCRDVLLASHMNHFCWDYFSFISLPFQRTAEQNTAQQGRAAYSKASRQAQRTSNSHSAATHTGRQHTRTHSTARHSTAMQHSGQQRSATHAAKHTRAQEHTGSTAAHSRARPASSCMHTAHSTA